MAKKEELTKKMLIDAGEELEEILEPTDDDKNPIKIIKNKKMKKEKMQEKIFEAGSLITKDDKISLNLAFVLKELNVEIKETEEIEKIFTWDDIKVMSKKELEKMCEEKNLIAVSDDYDHVKDFRIDVANELYIDVPEKELETEIKPTEPTKVISLEEIVAKTKKLVDLKELVLKKDLFKGLRKGLDEYKGLSGPKKLKAKMQGLLGASEEKKEEKEKKEKIETIKDVKISEEDVEEDVEEVIEESEQHQEEAEKLIEKASKKIKKAKSKKEKVQKKEKYNRVTSVSETIAKLGKKGFTIQEIQDESDKLYCEKTNNTEFDRESKKMHPATHIVNYMLTGLVDFSIIEKTDKIYKLK